MPHAFTSLFDEALDAWTDARQGVIAEVKNIPGDRFDFRPTPANRSVTELVQHIIEAMYNGAGPGPPQWKSRLRGVDAGL